MTDMKCEKCGEQKEKAWALDGVLVFLLDEVVYCCINCDKGVE